MQHTAIISNYEKVSQLSEQMREAARIGEWEELVSMEQQRNQYLRQSQSLEAQEKLDDESLRYKKQLIQKILANDKIVREHTECWLNRFNQAATAHHHVQ